MNRTWQEINAQLSQPFQPTEDSSKTSQELERDEKGRLLPGQASLNPRGRPSGKTLKEYQAEQFRMMTDEEKAAWLKDVAKDTRWKMSEGLPKVDVGISGELTSKIVSVDE